MNIDWKGYGNCEYNHIDAITTVLGTQSTRVKIHTHVFGCIVRFPLTPPRQSGECRGERKEEKEQHFFLKKEKTEKGRNGIVRGREGHERFCQQGVGIRNRLQVFGRTGVKIVA